VTTLLYLPVLIVSGPKALFANSAVRPLTLAEMRSLWPAGIAQTWKMLTQHVPGPLVWIFGAGFVIALVCHRRVAEKRIPVPVAAALCIVPLLIAQRVVPPPRVWVFLIPLFAMVSSAGLWFLVRFLADRDGTHRLSGVSAAMALGFALLLGSSVLRANQVTFRAYFPGIKDVAAWMKGHAMPGNIVVSRLPIYANPQLVYYLRRNGIRPVNHSMPCEGASLVFSTNAPPEGSPATGETSVLAMVIPPQTVESVLAPLCLPAPAFPGPKLVYTGPVISVYESHIDPDATRAPRSDGSSFSR
jgi:hypothetical protein